MTHDYNTRGEKDAGTFEDALESIEDNLRDDISHIKDVFIQGLEEKNLKSKERVSCLEDKVVQFEIKNNLFEQYGRRNNLKTERIPTSISDDELEKTAVGILNSINVDLDSSDVKT